MAQSEYNTTERDKGTSVSYANAPAEVIGYDDIPTSILSVKVPAANAPTEVLWNHGIGSGVTFPTLGFDVNDYVYIIIQTPHAMKLETVLDQHFHFGTPTDPTGKRAQFQLDVIAASVNEAWAVPTGSPFTNEIIFDSDLTGIHSLADIADIPAVNTTVSSLYKMKLTRIAATQDEYSGEIYIDFIDGHYKKDQARGSRQEYIK